MAEIGLLRDRRRRGDVDIVGRLVQTGYLESRVSPADARARGLTQLSYFQVDNPLARPADPLFLGLHAMQGAGMSSKVVAKRDAAEKVGVIGRANDKLGCIEYSEAVLCLLYGRIYKLHRLLIHA